MGEIVEGERQFLPWPQAEGEAIIKKLLPKVYSGPTILDIENALAFTSRGHLESSGLIAPRPSYDFLIFLSLSLSLRLSFWILVLQNSVPGEGFQQDGEQVHAQDQMLRERSDR